MILTPIAAHRLQPILASFAAGLPDPRARRVFARIARRRLAARAGGATATRHHRRALALAAAFGMGRRSGSPRSGYGWDGRALRTATEAYVLIHEVGHFQLAPPARRRLADFGLGPGPETGNRSGAERAAVIFAVAREREEAAASLLGILWEAVLGQPALASFLDQNWLEGAGAPRHFAAVLAALERDGFVSGTGRPTRRLRR
jgi:hypothetical protein